MKLFSKPAVLAAGVSLVSLAAQAAFTANDLYLGFSKTGAASDYIIDLGQASAVGLGGNLSAYLDMATFNSIFTSSSGVSMGVVGGQAQFPSSYGIYATAMRLGGAGTASVAGSDLSSFGHSQSVISSSISDLGQLTLPSAGNDLSDSGKAWTAHVLPLATGSFYGDSGVNPSSDIDGTGIIYEDLWKATPGGAYSYQGYFAFDSSGAGSLTFTPVPEPTTGSLFCVAGLCLGFFLRRNLKWKNA